MRFGEGRHGPAELTANQSRVGRYLNRVMVVSLHSYCGSCRIRFVPNVGRILEKTEVLMMLTESKKYKLRADLWTVDDNDTQIFKVPI